MACSDCGGLGTIEKDGVLYECQCERNLRIAASMEPYIRKAEFKDEHVSHPLIGMIGESCFIMASWADMKAIIKLTTIKHWPKKFIRITSDREIRDVYVGDRSKKAHAEDFQGKVYNTLEDLMSPPDLMVVRLNELSYKNVAAPGALEEALSYRFDRSRPVWVLSDIDRPFVEGSHAYSDRVVETIHSNCKRVSVPRIIPKVALDQSVFGTPVPTGAPAPQPVDRVGSGVPKQHKPFGRDDSGPPKQHRRDEPKQSDDLLDMIGSGAGASKKFKARS